MKVFQAIMLLLSIFTLTSQASNFQWIYDDNNDCAIWDDIDGVEKPRVYWTGTCRDKKAEGLGIAILETLTEEGYRPYFRFEGNIDKGMLDGKAYVYWYKNGNHASGVLSYSKFIGNLIYYFADSSTISIVSYDQSKPAIISSIKLSQATKESYNKSKKQSEQYQFYELISDEDIEAECIYLEHILNARKHEDRSGINPRKQIARSFTRLINCLAKNHQSDKALLLYKESLTYPKGESVWYKAAMLGALAQIYFDKQEYEKSLNQFELMEPSRYASNEILLLLDSDKFAKFNKLRSKIKVKFDGLNKNILFSAVRKGDINNLEIIKALLQKGVNVNAQESDGSTALMNAAYKGHAEIVKLLIENGANPNIADKDGNTPIYYAMKKDNVDVAKVLIENGADINYKNNDNVPFVVTTGYYDSPNMMKLLLESGLNVNTISDSGRTPLMTASRSGNIDIVKYLIEKGADANITTKWEIEIDKKTALSFAYQKSREQIALLLINHLEGLCNSNNSESCYTLAMYYRLIKNKDLNLKYHSRSCSLGYAKSCFWAGSITYFKNNKEGLRFHEKGCNLGSERSCKSLAQKNTDINHKIKYLDSPCKRGDVESCRLLAFAYNKKNDKKNEYFYYSIQFNIIQNECDLGDLYRCDDLNEIRIKMQSIKTTSLRKHDIYLKPIKFLLSSCQNKNYNSCNKLIKLSSDKELQIDTNIIDIAYNKIINIKTLGCKNNDSSDCHYLGNIYSIDNKKYKNINKASYFYKKGFKLATTGCKNNISTSCQELAYMYMDGEGVKKNYDQAISYAKKTCGLENDKLCHLIDSIKISKIAGMLDVR